MSFSVDIAGFAGPLEVAMGETILEAALRQGLPYPHGCRSGNCGACKSELAAGEVEMAPCSEFALTEAEKAQGLILACRAVPWSDCAVRVLEAEEVVAHPLRRLTCRVRALEDATHDIKLVRLAVEAGGPFSFTAGQYASLRFADLPARDFSMANRPDERELEFHIRLVPGGAVSPHVRHRLAIGDAVRVDGPYGSAYLRAHHAGPILACAGGSGLAPIRSIVETALAHGLRQPIAVYLGVRAERDVYGLDRFATLAARHPNLRVVPVLSQPDGPGARRTGFLADVLRADFAADSLDGAKAYLAGPPPMVETCTAALLALGLRRQDIHADAFYTAAERAAANAEVTA